MSDTLIKVKSAEYFYTGEEQISLPAISGIDLVVNRGEHIALVGPNGSGKTTLLKLLNALLIPAEGTILIDGICTTDEHTWPQIRKKVGMIFQNPDNQLVATTVEEDIAFGLENMAVCPEEIRRLVSEVSSLLGLKELLHHPPHLLSGGEKQRVAIAGILVMQPDCILMDEPTAMLDPAGCRSVMETVIKLNKEQNIAIIHATHSPEEAALAKRVLVLDRGKLVGQGPPEEVLTDLPMLHKLGLESTTAAELAGLLQKDGFTLPPKILHNRELVDSLCSLELKS